jgi:ankyrin repeat protein
MVSPNSFPSGLQAALALAAGSDDVAAIGAALAAGAHVDLRGQHGVTALMLAVDKQKPRAVSALLQAGADPNLAADDGMTAVALAVRNYRTNPSGLDIMKTVFKAGGNPNSRMANGDPVVVFFIAQHDCDAIRLLKSYGADLDIRDRENDPVITTAAVTMDWDVVWCLIELGARSNYENGAARLPLSKSLANKAPSSTSPLYAFKVKVWEHLKSQGVPLAPLPVWK